MANNTNATGDVPMATAKATEEHVRLLSVLDSNLKKLIASDHPEATKLTQKALGLLSVVTLQKRMFERAAAKVAREAKK